ncbi:MAG TPA: thiamine pyrophosphate-requiring protein [Dehalococcoidia bacterium]|jgi:thiamine pyrophosphate-dependent acetolactate synthase large subunit-like protein|nr:thiamine pyrophosphate-requiring protein [Dehalococcoidia bacterium]HIK88836.1 thiamine pyrophosphate-requiring protein [Dehalococcoidia bacterium]
MNGTEFIAQILKQEGVNEMTCFPSNALIEAAAKEGIRPVMFRHERGAIMAADGYSRMSAGNKFGVVAMQHAAGAENSMGGLSQAFGDNVPILVLPGGYPIEQRHVRPNFSAVENWKGVTKSVESINTPSQIKDVMRRAFHALRNGNGGPVVVEMTLDVCAMEVPEDALGYTSPSVSKSVPSKTDIQDAVKALLASARPMIWAGAGVLMAQASAELAEFAELTDIPVFTTMEGKSAYDERLPLSLGAGSGATTGPAFEWINESDVVIGLGTSLSLNSYTRRVPAGKSTVIHNTINSAEINKGTPSDIGLVGDAKLTLQALIEEVKAQIGEDGRDTGVASHIATVKAKWLEEWSPILNSDEAPLNPYRVINEINKNLDHENSVVTHDAGGPRDCMVPFYTATTPNSYIGWGKTTHLGFGIPLMIGAKLADPSKFCLNYMGDGAWGMSGTDTAAAARMGLPITTVLLNNGGMATYPGGFPTAREQYDVSSMEGDYAMITEGMGGVGIRVSQPEELGPAILKARQLNDEGKTVLIDVKSNYESRKSFFGR